MKREIGYLSMRFEEEEKRDFRPSYFNNMKDIPNPILLDYGYGKKMGYSEEDYIASNPNIVFTHRESVLNSDVLVSIRTPIDEELKMMKNGSVIFSMLHFVTHERRNQLLSNMGIKMYAMDSIVDEFGERMIQDFPGTVHNAMIAGFSLLDITKIQDKCRVLVIGTGEIGKLVAPHSIKLSPLPTIVCSIGRSITRDKLIMEQLLNDTDVLVDTSKRTDTSQHIIFNNMVELLPKHAVIIDISADDYDTKISPMQVKGIEGIPTGNLEQYLFDVNDPAYEKIPASVNKKYRRKLASCYSWPGVNPGRCLDRYETQIEPFIRIIAQAEINAKKSNSPYAKALERSSYDYYKNFA